ncbi:MAG TPA: prolyl oligopeptidase family serine peptidase [Chlamydiales bacterium]|nr:prolyl oligopeptidase family serine peptidase [Chlamydiales bacterium]
MANKYQESQITFEMVALQQSGIQEIYLDQDKLYYQKRILIDGKFQNVLIDYDSKKEVLKNKAFGTRVHEYGGKALFIENGHYFYSNAEDGMVYHCHNGKETQLTFDLNRRYVEFAYDEKNQILLAVRESHLEKVENEIVQIDLKTHKESVLFSDSDFFSSIVFNQDKTQFAYLCWNVPNMPWDGCLLVLCDWEEGRLQKKQVIAGGYQESIFQPMFSWDNDLYYVSDKTGFWNPYLYKEGKSEIIIQKEMDFAVPAWVFGLSTYALLTKNGKNKILAIYYEKGIGHLCVIDPDKKSFRKIEIDYWDFSSLQGYGEKAYFIAKHPVKPQAVLEFDFESETLQEIIKDEKIFEEKFLSMPFLVSFSTGEKETSYGFYYPPKVTRKELPPLILMCHGGPVWQAKLELDLKKQFWTSRGFAVFDLNYRGSTGFGRAYRDRLKKNWGIVDVEDCINAVQYLIQKQLADPKKIIIRGSSAGGYTALMALTKSNLFKAGVSYYGISDLEALWHKIPKFEKGMMEQLIGAYPQERQRYNDLSPLHYVEKISSSVLLFQGLKDTVVPSSQSELMFTKLKKNKVPCFYISFPEEGHGFRDPKVIREALERELCFYQKMLDFEKPTCF